MTTIASEDASSTKESEVAEEVVVTGTHIRGAPPVGVNLVTVTQDDIRKGGFTRIEEVLRMLPQNFGGGPREDAFIQQDSSRDRTLSTNMSKGATANLRGLGAGATLVLIDGRRLSPSGTTGLFTDISNLPLAAVERIEILTDGASALYGSDAVGGVINVILRKDFRGAETVLRVTDGSGGTNDYHASQLFGLPWSTGRATLSYEFVKRDGLRAASRPFSADSDQRRNGGDNFSMQGGNPGTIFIGTRSWAIPANQDGTALAPSDFVEGTTNFRNESKFLWLLPEQDRHGATATLSQALGERITFWAHGSANRRKSHVIIPWADSVDVPSSNPYYVNPTGGTGPVRVRYDFTEDFGNVYSDAESRTHNVDAGFDFALPRGWRITVDAARGEEHSERDGFGIDRRMLAVVAADDDPATALNVFGDGAFTNPATIDKLRARTYGDARSSLDATNVLVEGPLLSRRAGDVRLALGAEYRDYGYESSNGTADSTGDRLLNSAKDGRQIDAFFTELRIPLIGANNRRALIHELTLSAAVRREQYSDFGNSTVPKFGLTFSPVRDFRLRAAWSESFRAPDLSSLDESRNSFTLRSLPDPQGPNGSSMVLQWSGGNRALKPETAENLSAGFDWKVGFVPGLRFSGTYFDIRYVNQIGSPFVGLASTADFLGDPRYAPFVYRSPSAEQREQACSGINATVSKQTCLTTPIGALLDSRTANTALLRTNGLDFELNYTRDTDAGTLGAGIVATYILGYKQATVETAPTVSLLNRKYAPVDTRLRANASFNRGPWNATAFLNYVDDYTDVGTTVRKVDSWTTVDMDVSYDVTDGSTWLTGLSVALNAQNVLDEDPPFVNTAFGYDIVNANPYGRVVSLLLRKSW